MTETVSIAAGTNSVTGRLIEGGPTGILLAHGAGTNQDHPFMILLRDGLAAGGHTILTFNYPYSERGSKRPDRTEQLVACHRSAAELLAGKVDRLFLAGRSMGGRIGTYVAAEGFRVDGLVLYAYPLHPAGKPDSLRIDQFASIDTPLLFFQGTRDALSRMELFEEHIAGLPNAEFMVLEGASHSPRGGGWTPESTAARLAEGTLDWIASRLAEDRE